MAGYHLEIQLKGFDEFRRKLEDAPNIVAEVKYKMMDKIVTFGRERASFNAPRHDRDLVHNIEEMSRVVTFSGDFHGVIASNLIYAKPMEYGTRPFYPKVTNKFKKWARDKLGNEGLAYAVAKNIGKRGLKGRFYMKKTIGEIGGKMKDFMKYGLEIVNKLSFRS